MNERERGERSRPNRNGDIIEAHNLYQAHAAILSSTAIVGARDPREISSRGSYGAGAEHGMLPACTCRGWLVGDGHKVGCARYGIPVVGVHDIGPTSTTLSVTGEIRVSDASGCGSCPALIAGRCFHKGLGELPTTRGLVGFESQTAGGLVSYEESPRREDYPLGHAVTPAHRARCEALYRGRPSRHALGGPSRLKALARLARRFRDRGQG